MSKLVISQYNTLPCEVSATMYSENYKGNDHILGKEWTLLLVLYCSRYFSGTLYLKLV